MEISMKAIRFKFLSIGLLLCPLFNSAMEMPNKDVKTSYMLVSIANQSEQPVYAFVSDQLTIQPYEDKNDYVVSTVNSPGIQTATGIYTLALDNVSHPTSFILNVFKEGKDISIQKIPYNEVNNIILIVNPDSSVTVAQGNPAHAAEKIREARVGEKVQPAAEKIQSNVQMVKNPYAKIRTFMIETVTGYDKSIIRTFSAVISFNQKPSTSFMNEFMAKLQQSLQGPVEIQIRPDGESVSIKGNTNLKQVDLQKTLNFLNGRSQDQ